MSLSKTFNIAIEGAKCAEVFHPGQSCLSAAWWTFTRTWISGGQIYFPIVFIPMLKKNFNITKNDLKEAFKEFFWLTTTGYLASSFTLAFMCIFSKLRGRITYWWSIYIPGIFGGTAIFLMPPKDSFTYAHSAFTILIEMIIKDENCFHVIQTSKFIRTMLFMGCSSAIMDCLKSKDFNILWFLRPSTRNQQDSKEENYGPSPILDYIMPCEKHVCLHASTCDDFVKTGFTTYAKIGFALELVRILIGNFGQIKSNPSNFHRIFLTKMNTNLIGFLVTYSTGYRILNCLLNRHYRKDCRKSNMIAGFLSGISFYVYPDLSILAHAIGSVVEFSWIRYIESMRNDFKFIDYLSRLPKSKIFFCVSVGYVFHTKTFYPWLTSRFFNKVYHLTPKGRMELVQQNFFKRMFNM